MKSLEVSEEKANQRVEEFKREMKTLTVRLKEAENRAEQAEKQVKRLQKEVDRLEGTVVQNPTDNSDDNHNESLWCIKNLYKIIFKNMYKAFSRQIC